MRVDVAANPPSESSHHVTGAVDLRVAGGGGVESLLTISRDHGASRGDVQPLTLSLWIVDDWRRWNPEMTGCSVAEVVMREFWFCFWNWNAWNH